jgi:salicylate hydroxylase
MSLTNLSVQKGFDNCATTYQWQSKQDFWFEFRYGQDEEGSEPSTGKLFHYLKCPNGQATSHRAKFIDKMIQVIPENIAHFGKRLISIEDLGGKGVHLKFGDGTVATYSAVIGCDGNKSETRKYVLGRNKPAAYVQWMGKYCHRGLTPMSKAAKAIGEELAMNNEVYLGVHGHILTFPIEKGKTFNNK